MQPRRIEYIAGKRGIMSCFKDDTKPRIVLRGIQKVLAGWQIMPAIKLVG
jgi:hypothetical protein